MKDSERNALRRESVQLTHAMQSAIAYGIGLSEEPTREHKHLRVGIGMYEAEAKQRWPHLNIRFQ